MFIAIEGIDASGKHTQTEKLKCFFAESQDFKVHKFDFPKYESVTGRLIRDYLHGVWRAEIDFEKVFRDASIYLNDPSTYLFQCCQLVNRLECLPDELWSDSKDIFIADRYNASAYAYGLALGIDLDWLLKTHRHLPQPDINIYLDISVEESFNRRPERRDEYEKNVEMLRDVRQSYLEIFGKLGPTYHVIDATGSIDEIHTKILDKLHEVGLKEIL